MPTIPAQTQSALAASPARVRLRVLQARLAAMLRTHRERNELARLHDRDLRDFASTRLDAQAEARRRFWDLPPMA